MMTASVGGVGGIINPSGNVSVAGGQDISFNISPELGYYILNMNIDGTFMGS